jgi:hypothetical protein
MVVAQWVEYASARIIGATEKVAELEMGNVKFQFGKEALEFEKICP